MMRALAGMEKELLIGGALVLALFLLLKKKGIVTDAVAGAVGAVGDAAAGIPIGIGDALGVPRTDMTECERAKAEGRTWDASFACPAGDFIGYVFN